MLHIRDFGLRSNSICSIPFLFPLELKFYSQKTQFYECKLNSLENNMTKKKKKRFINEILRNTQKMLSSLLICKIKTSLKAKHNSKHKCESVGSYYLHPQTGVREKDRQRIRQSRYQLGRRKNKIFLKH